jgi:NAD(P)-dependent dehydrogenase (short-subunit alcohol dehydrogenase family)
MTEAGRLDGKVALVTGGAAGIGLATARRFVAEGARVVIGDIAVANLDAAGAELGDAVVTSRCDVTSEDDVAALVALAVERFGRLDIAVANAGAGTASLLIDHPLDEWRRIIDLCLTGVFLTVKHAGRAIADAGGGALICIASLNAIQPGRGMGAYCSAKAGVAMLTEVAAMELGPAGVRCNAIAPGFVYTQLTDPVGLVPGVVEEYIENTPLGRGAQPTEIADVALFLASGESSFMNGALVSVDGGARTQRYPDIIGGVERMMAGG